MMLASRLGGMFYRTVERRNDQHPSLVIVFTPGKTGTKSLSATLQSYFRDLRAPDKIVFHTHWLFADQIANLAEGYREKSADERASRVTAAEELAKRFANADDSVVFTTVRHPQARMMSDFYYRFPALLERCRNDDGSIAALKELNSVLSFSADFQARKEAAWWTAYAREFGFRLRDLPEIAEKGYAIRRRGGRSLVVLKLEEMDLALPSVFRDLDWSTQQLRPQKKNVSAVSASLRTTLEASLKPLRPLILDSECIEDWAAAYPDLQTRAAAPSTKP